MATPLAATTLLAALKAEGCTVVEYKSWRTHNRNHKGAWGPVNGVMIHHTVSSGEDSSVALCYNGHSALPGPLCHTVGGKSGKLYMVGHGRANHAGSGDDDVLRAVINETALPADNEADTDGNARFYGLEIVNLGNGKDTYPTVQYDAAVRWAAAICRTHGWGAGSVIGHKEWQPGKIDPHGPVEGRGSFDMDRFRADVAERLKHPASWSPGTSTPAPAKPQTPTPTPPKEDDVSAYELWAYKGTGETRDAYAYLRGTNTAIQALTAQIGALSATVGKLAEGGGLDASEIEAAAEAGARAALEKLGEHLTDQS
ncbi:N-acetylmuramoyl-L-alanine amidase [Streptomyces albogriseolus]